MNKDTQDLCIEITVPVLFETEPCSKPQQEGHVPKRNLKSAYLPKPAGSILFTYFFSLWTTVAHPHMNNYPKKNPLKISRKQHI